MSIMSKDITVVKDMLAWVEQNKPEHYEMRSLQLIELLRRLTSVSRTLDDNASIAVMGEVHSGKSYLLYSLLQDSDHQFKIKANDGGHDFGNEINPLPSYHKSTGIITRFTSYNSFPQRYNLNYPVVARLLSVTDIVVILCKAYYDGICDCSWPTLQALEDRAELIVGTFSALPKQKEPLVKAEEVLAIKSYFKKHLLFPQVFNHSSFFEKVALVAENIPSNEWLPSVFSFLWDNNQEFDRLYTRLVSILLRLEFTKEIYLPIDAVLHHDNDCNTILSIANMRDLFKDNVEFVTDVYVRKGDDFQQIGTLGKNMIKAVCKEVVFKVEMENISFRRNYSVDDITPEVRELLNTNGFEPDFLLNCDLLDFPGLYSLYREHLCHLKEDDRLITSVYDYAKTQYLFDKYNEECQISALLFCHNYRNCSITGLWSWLQEWVESKIGKTSQERDLTLNRMGGISLLFNICTMFNIDMQESPNPAANERKALDRRWYGRFKEVLYRECFHADDVEWMKNWTHPGEFFNNSYLLRDFKYSGAKASRLYSGFATEGCEREMIISKTFYDTMRDSFCNDETTNLFFENPALSWDVAATRNNDGSLRILEKLNDLSHHLCEEREKKCDKQLDDLRSIICRIQQM